MNYEVDLDGESVSFDPGTNVLLAGPGATSDEMLYGAVAQGIGTGESAILISTATSADSVVAGLDARGAIAPDRVGIVDCTGREGPDEVDGVRVNRLGSPGDLTGMSLEFAKLLQGFEDAGVGDEVRVGTVSVSTLLETVDVRTVFRFLHVFTSRIRSADLLGLFTIDPSRHEAQTVNTVRAIFDCEVELTEDGETTFYGAGYHDE